MSAGIGVFTRAPVAGATKTRLIPLLGAAGAARAHWQLLDIALRAAVEACPGGVTVFVAGEMPALALPMRAQVDGDLGARMQAALEWLWQRHEQALVIGSDCAVLTAGVLREAALALHDHDLVFVPAEDGGYVLVGARRGTLQLGHVFHGIPWSSAAVMATTRLRVQEAGLRHAEIGMLWDVDEPADWQRAVAAGLVRDEVRS
ncbi:MAG TPA: TIGR04282 family arsenosugar biosynthesis glycosyltransferase [Burkholderiaceae bacterium]|nr:TIGR04282 family arsenosugar biosynthesis glycosyltransferase [Burkholderiaceae bacterium]